MWCTPTNGLLSAAARVRAALPHTLRHPGRPKQASDSHMYLAERLEEHTWSESERNPIHVVYGEVSFLERALDGSWLGSSGGQSRTSDALLRVAWTKKTCHIPLMSVQRDVGVYPAILLEARIPYELVTSAPCPSCERGSQGLLVYYDIGEDLAVRSDEGGTGIIGRGF